MKIFRTTNTRLIAGLLSGLLFATMAVSLDAHAASVSRPGRGFGPVYDAAREITFEGTIQEVVLKHTAGSPAGMHLMVAGPNGLVDAHVGPFMSKETKEVLQAGVPVRIVGANTTVHGKTYFLTRQLTVDGNTITVRNPRGFLVMAHSNRPHIARTKAGTKIDTTRTEPGFIGGAR
jgi:hypothetical protein